MTESITLFENLTPNFFKNQGITLSDNYDPDNNLFDNHNIKKCIDTPYFELTGLSSNPDLTKNTFSTLHLNIRSMQIFIESFKHFISQTKQTFSVICLTETWLTNETFSTNTQYDLADYNGSHFQRSTNKTGGGICIFVHNSLSFKIRDDLSVSNPDN